jgi:hypothetical protein
LGVLAVKAVEVVWPVSGYMSACNYRFPISLTAPYHCLSRLFPDRLLVSVAKTSGLGVEKIIDNLFLGGADSELFTGNSAGNCAIGMRQQRHFTGR